MKQSILILKISSYIFFRRCLKRGIFIYNFDFCRWLHFKHVKIVSNLPCNLLKRHWFFATHGEFYIYLQCDELLLMKVTYTGCMRNRFSCTQTQYYMLTWSEPTGLSMMRCNSILLDISTSRNFGHVLIEKHPVFLKFSEIYHSTHSYRWRTYCCLSSRLWLY